MMRTFFYKPKSMMPKIKGENTINSNIQIQKVSITISCQLFIWA